MVRGDVYRFRPSNGAGHEQPNERYGGVVQSDAFLPRSVVGVAPTSRSARAATFRPEVRVAGETTRVLVEQVGALDARRLGERAGHLTRDEMWSVDQALADVLGLL